MGDITTEPRLDQQKSVPRDESRLGKTHSRLDTSRARPTARKRKAIKLSSPLSSVPSSDAESNDAHQPEGDARPISGTIKVDNKLEPYSAQPISSPPLGLVTQLPVMSMGIDEEDSQVSLKQPSPTVQSRGGTAAQGDSSLPDASSGQTDGVVAQRLKIVEVAPPAVSRYLWELDDDEDGLLEVDVSLDKASNF